MDELTHELSLPSGLRVSLREPAVHDIRLLSGRRKEAERKLSPKNLRDPLAEFFGGLTVEVSDVGPYVWPSCPATRPDGLLHWPKLLQGDTSQAMLRLRRAMFTEESLGYDGDFFHFELTCSSLACKLPIPWRVRLSELEQHSLSDAARERLKLYGPELTDLTDRGEPDPFVHLRLPKSRTLVRWKLLTREDQHRVDQVCQSDPDHLEEHSILARLPYIAGAGTPGERLTFAAQLPWFDKELLQQTWRKHDAWTQEILEVECPHCRLRQRLGIPFGDDFFSLTSVAPRPSSSNSSDASSSTSVTTSSAAGG